MSSAPPCRVVIAGAAGRMGRTLLTLAAADPGLRVVGALEAAGHPEIGTDAGSLAGNKPLDVAVSNDTDAALAAADVLVEFTYPEPSLEHARACARAARGVVLGTTGFDASQQKELEELAQKIPIVQASNMSVGVTVLAEVVEQVARRLGESFDIEVLEAHHRLKKDAPSGTALTLARAAATGRDARLEDWAVHGRSGFVGERPDAEMGILALRGGDVIGDHTVYFFGKGERLELTHRAQSRDAFASGALRAARWVAGRPPGLYTIRDVLFGAGESSRR